MWRVEKEEGGGQAIVIEGAEQGIAPSPHKGIANLQAVNIATDTGEVMCSYARTQQSQVGTTAATFTVAILDGNHLTTSANVTNGVWITVGAGITGLAAGNYYVQNSSGTASSAASTFQLSTYYNGSLTVGFSGGGTATGNLLRALGQPIASATEPYSNGTQQYRYYMLDGNGLVWVYDSALTASQVTGTLNWFLPDASVAYYGSATPTGLAILNGWLHVFAGNGIWCKPTVNLGDTTSASTNWAAFASGALLSTLTSTNPHFAFVGHHGKCYYTDGNFLGDIFPNTSLLTGLANIQSYASYTTAGTTGTIATLLGGSLPTFGGTSTSRVPAVFFPSLGGANPTALTIGTVYYIKYLLGSSAFEVYLAATGGSALDIDTGKGGTLYYDTYYPTSAGGEATITFSPERLNFPFFEITQSIAELGSTLVIGCKSNTIYPWNQVDATPGDLISLPENNVAFMLTVNNMVYIFAGNKGNVYITSGSSAAKALSVPDYCAGIAGTPATYIEPYFTWGGAMYLRGRVYFSILDQTASKVGNCGGVWSFIPAQNFYIGEDVGQALRLENQNSYGSYSGVATVLLASQNQLAPSPQYWSGWYSSISSPLYGIDVTSTTTSTPAVIETDLIPTGTVLGKKTFANIEYKLAAPLAVGESVGISYRLNGTAAYTSLGGANVESSTELAGYFSPLPFENSQWLQLKVTLTPLTSSSSSFVRLQQIRIR